VSDSASKEDAKKRTAPPHAFKKGQSGNPAGRAKRTPEELDLIAACKEKTPLALDTIVSIMQKGENERNKLAAAQYVIDRAYGKAVQALDAKVKGELGLTVMITRFSGEDGK